MHAVVKSRESVLAARKEDFFSSIVECSKQQHVRDQVDENEVEANVHD